MNVIGDACTVSADVERMLEVLASACEPPRAAADMKADDELAALGIDSLKFLLLVVEIESAIGRSVFEADGLGQVSRVGDLINLVEQ